VVGQGLPQPLALLTLTEQARQLPHHEVERELEALLQRVNREMSRHEQLACMVVISDAWHRDAEATTATMLLRRGVIRARYHEFLGDWLVSGSTIVWQ
jgi:long-subunit acyl-CoA synthetase (AMP-forming)